MTSSLDSFVNCVISVITGDGRNIVGMLKGFDQLVNLVLTDSHERFVSRCDYGSLKMIQIGL